MELSLHRCSGLEEWEPALPEPQRARSTLLLLFGPARLADGQLDQVRDLHHRYPGACIVGCSSAGEVFGREFSDGSLVLAACHFQHTEIRFVSEPVPDSEQSGPAGATIGDRLRADTLSAVFVLTDGLTVNGSAAIRGLSNALDSSVAITGGMAADGDRFERTWVLIDGEPRSGYISAVGFYGDAVQVGYGSRGGWDTLGPDREVTASKDNVLFELDGQPALALYKRYLGERAVGLPATGLLFPLAIPSEEGGDELTVRTILGIDEDAQSITFAGDIPQGSRVRLMRANFDRLIDGAAMAAERIEAVAPPAGDVLCIAISCVGRRLVLGERVEEEIEAVMDGLKVPVKQIGFYSYGEFSPLGVGSCDLHNQTMTLTLLWEQP